MNHSYFMQIAELSASLSHCTRRKVGATLVRNNFIIATGRNGTLPGHDNCCENPDGSTSDFTLHAEQNILTFCNREGILTKDTSIYITLSPCKICAKLLASAGITKVFYLEKYKDSSGLGFLNAAGIETFQMILEQ